MKKAAKKSGALIVGEIERIARADAKRARKNAKRLNNAEGWVKAKDGSYSPVGKGEVND